MRNRDEIINIAATNADIGQLSSDELAKIVAWFDFFVDEKLSSNNYIWALKKYFLADIQSVTSDNALYKYAYDLPLNNDNTEIISNVFAINADEVIQCSPAASFEQSISVGVVPNLRGFGTCSGSNADSYQFNHIGNRLYTQVEVVNFIAKQRLPIEKTPIEFQSMMMHYASARFFSDRGDRDASANYEISQAKEQEVKCISRRALAVNMEQQSILDYFYKVVPLARIFT